MFNYQITNNTVAVSDTSDTGSILMLDDICFTYTLPYPKVVAATQKLIRRLIDAKRVYLRTSRRRREADGVRVVCQGNKILCHCYGETATLHEDTLTLSKKFDISKLVSGLDRVLYLIPKEAPTLEDTFNGANYLMAYNIIVLTSPSGCVVLGRDAMHNGVISSCLINQCAYKNVSVICSAGQLTLLHEGNDVFHMPVDKSVKQYLSIGSG